MLRQVSSRNQRGKGGLKLKNALQVCLLVAICVWLLYQMKHSHDKKRSYEESGSKVSFKNDQMRLGIIKFGRPRTTVTEMKSQTEDEEQKDAESLDHSIRHQEFEDEEEGRPGDDDHEMSHEEDKKGQTKKEKGFEDGDLEEASHKAREISFKGDDASSEVVHIIREVEHEQRFQEARERSFKADDASSAVAHVPQVEELESESESGAMRNQDDESESKNKDGNVTNGTLEDSSGSKLLDKSEGNNSSVVVPVGSETMHNNNTVILENVSPPKYNYNDLRIASAISSNQTDNAVELQTKSTSFSKTQIYFHKNSTTASVEWNNGGKAIKVDSANVTVLQNQTAAV